jgi:hypothetical protein
MEENKNIEQEQSLQNINEEINSRTENILPDTETAASDQQQSTIPTLEIKDMEVHHHGHVHENKKWKEYFFQFLMLFLAVFLGFLAEYQLEHVIEQQKEKQYIESLVEDLKSDQQVLTKHIEHVKAGTLMMDTVISILNNPSQVVGNSGQLYYLARRAPRLNPLTTNNRTFEQLKNSGNFRLIKKLSTSNKIMSYYEKFPLIRLLESVNQTEFNEYQKVAAKIFSPAVFLKMEGINDKINRTTENPPLRVVDNDLLQQLSVFAVYLRGTKKGITGAGEEVKLAGAELLNFLQKEYHLENE